MKIVPSVDTKFTLGEKVTRDQIDFFNHYGFIHYKHFISKEKAERLAKSLDEASEYIVMNGIEKINSIPVKTGFDENGKKFVNRMPYSSKYSKEVEELYLDSRFELLKIFLPEYNLRIGMNEKDGVVANHYLNTKKSSYKQLGWHTDILRDLFMYGKLYPMLNVGVYITDSGFVNGGLRVIPCTHQQSLFRMLFQKIQILNTKEDKNEILVEAEAGDLCLHGGRLWHRVARSPFEGEKSRRRVMYVPFICGPVYERKEEDRTPFYQKIGRRIKFN